MSIDTIIHKELLNQWVETMTSPAAIHVNPADLTELSNKYFKSGLISQWVNGYSGGTPIEVISDQEVPTGTVELVAA